MVLMMTGLLSRMKVAIKSIVMFSGYFKMLSLILQCLIINDEFFSVVCYPYIMLWASFPKQLYSGHIIA